MTSRPPISPGNSAGMSASRRLSGLSRGRSTTAPLPRPGEGRRVRNARSGAPGDHAMSVAMPDCRANSSADSTGMEDSSAPPPAVRVMLPLPLPEPLDCLLPAGAAMPEEFDKLAGSFVRVSLGSRRLIGVVWDGRSGESERALRVERLKPIIEILPTPKLQPELRRFVERTAAYTLSPPGMVLRMAMSVEQALLPPAPRRVCVATAAGLAALADAGAAKPLTASRRRGCAP